MFDALSGTDYGVFHHYFILLGRLDIPDPDFQYELIENLQDEDEIVPSVPPASEDDIKNLEDELQKNLEQMETKFDLYRMDAFNILLISVDSRSDSMSGRHGIYDWERKAAFAPRGKGRLVRRQKRKLDEVS
ncbi:hypothetical protein [uncultured Dysosmobacter sp.]|uniref:hypothetical protein n=1 Tax=uncultured Dysosmobacter sp. TaxID=2591384 RepID=UPI00262C8AC7|nr:hypothetical protein [uncultured Dysosmobacter sp.]